METQRSTAIVQRLPEIIRFVLLVGAITLASAAAVAPIVYLLRRLGVG